jgi:uncharacterized membrane protein YhaH (DUF805 family)
VDTINWQNLLFEFRGRINRAKFWTGLIVLFAFEAVLTFLAAVLNSGAFEYFVWMILVICIWPAVAISVKRWHDRNKSGWWVFIGLIPLIGFLWVLIECGLLPGDQGYNDYGPDPLAPADEGIA